jgi:hypothetical protein
MAKLISGTRIYGNATIDSNLTVGTFANISSGSVSADSALQIYGNVSRGGAGYHDFLRVTSTASGAINPNKHFRVGPQGNLQIIDSTYTTNLFDLSNAGALVVPSYVKTGSTVFASLPTASVAAAGARAFVTDANTAVFGSAVSGSGAISVPVYSDGSAWRVG